MRRTLLVALCVVVGTLVAYPPLPARAADTAPKATGALVDEGSEQRRILRVQRTRRARKARFDDIVRTVSGEYGVRSDLVHALIWVESAYDSRAVSPKGAAGLMQLMPATATRFGVADRFDPAQNIGAGVAYLRELDKRFNGDISLVLAAYNAGEAAVEEYGNSVPPYPETREFVRRVLATIRGNGPGCWTWQGQTTEVAWGEICESRTPQRFEAPRAFGSR